MQAGLDAADDIGVVVPLKSPPSDPIGTEAPFFHQPRLSIRLGLHCKAHR
jgi:hypothetical protein